MDLLGFLDYEIWKASHMLSQDIPLRNRSESKDQEWEEFGPTWSAN